MTTINDIREKLKVGQNNPHDLADYRAYLSAEYSFIQDRLAEIYARRAPLWMEMRKETQSDRAADRMWEASQDGVNEVALRHKAKGIEKLISACSSLIRVAEGEAKNQF